MPKDLLTAAWKLLLLRGVSGFKVTLHGGKQEGVDLVVVDNGRLQITLIASDSQRCSHARGPVCAFDPRRL